jgi:hypothetical protein
MPKKTSSCQPNIRVSIHKQLQVEHFPQLLVKKYQNSFNQNDIGCVNLLGTNP